MDDPTLDERLRALEDRIAALEAQQASEEEATTASGAVTADVPQGTRTPQDSANADPMWALKGLQEQAGAGGGIVFAGDLPQTAAGPVSWQYGRPAAHFDSLDFTTAAGSLDALGHPVRLGLLQEIHRGTTSVAGLSELGVFGSTGQIYHHLQQLASAGWLESPHRGQWRIPAHRLVPVLTIILAALG
ncbi:MULTISPECIES: ArsR/SmtB family transcription factor [Brevibacterium]|uniref:ArsR family transcriptional regulator n=2 Tax=Brevibacterium TaxID=1696 RepID=A0A2N6PG97_9MICO|nr:MULTISPECIES: winged helix-turn-helix domain-containing protein [Brevibacterium]MBD8019672.1 winged helix-turn-helix transcriptional regulator [Brevibacterium gallinarum]MCT1872422.1 winged helix-turn-helix domain-containing protein [Brevibacterium luteolum]MCT1890162.1 winged helix-turn-helix domain-containing protein [Brevibacterium luteolum]MCT1892682.1 winged helix-turn-helix domain-containing protein [Brevibacterium luteolum]MCT1920520.1 winged helix-turn-helix domain-containing protei